MKKLLLFVVVAALALTLVPLALAGAPGGGGWKHGKAKFNLVGTVTAVTVADTTADPAAVSTVTIKVKAGTKSIRSLGTEATFVVAGGTSVWLLSEDGAVAKTLADVTAGDKVKARGMIAKVDDGSGDTTLVCTVKNLKYHDLTPDVAPPVTP